MSRLGRFAAVVLVAVVVGACGSADSSDRRSVSEHFEDARVDVEVHLERDEAALVIVATFRPTSSDLHLYGAGLPRDGIDGAGRPTRIDVVDTGWRTVGPLSDEPKAALLPVAGFVVPFPTYPEGPVTLRQAIASSGARADHAVDVQVTFMACSSAGLCYKPEIGHPMVVPAP